METIKKEEGKQIANKKRSDWCKALSHYSNEQKICQSCFTQKSLLSNFVLPLGQAVKKLEGVNLKDFEMALRHIGKPIIFSNTHIKSADSFLVYYTHGISFEELPSTLPLYYQGIKPTATIVSPDYYSKSKRTSETQLVREIQKYFNPTAFIKLPIYEMADLISYAASEKCDTLILPTSKLAEYLTLVLDSKNQEIIPAVFYPIND